MQGKKSLVCSLLHCSAAESPLVLEGHSHVLVPLYASLPTRGEVACFLAFRKTKCTM